MKKLEREVIAGVLEVENHTREAASAELKEALDNNRVSVRLLSESLEMGADQTRALESFLVEDICTDDEALFGALQAVQPLLKSRLRGDIQTDAEKISGRPDARLNTILDTRLSLGDFDSLPSLDQAATTLRFCFDDNKSGEISVVEAARLQSQGLALFAFAARGERDTADTALDGHQDIAESPTSARSSEQGDDNSDIGQPEAEEYPNTTAGIVARYVLTGEGSFDDLRALTPEDMRRGLAQIAGHESLVCPNSKPTVEWFRFQRLNGIIQAPYEPTVSPADVLLSGPEMPWKEDARCRDEDRETFFPTENDPTSRRAIKAAKEICVQCDVWRECLDYALANKERFGVWGGRTPRERENLLKK